MPQKIALTSLWVGFGVYAFFFAPSNQTDTLDLIFNLSSGNIQGINPMVVALFNIMGVLPMAYSCFTYLDGRGQKIPAWLFTVTSFFLGAFALLPYLILRQPSPVFGGRKNWFLRLLDARITGFLIAAGAIALFTYGILKGDWGNFVQQWQTSRFIHVMSLDFCVLNLLFPVLLKDDMTRRGLKDSSLFWVISLIPFLGPMMYLALRPPTLEQTQSTTSPSTSA